jgi:hypothetical protein
MKLPDLSEGYKQGFVEQCIEAGLSEEQTEVLFKAAHASEAMNSGEIGKGVSEVLNGADLSGIPKLAQAKALSMATGYNFV